MKKIFLCLSIVSSLSAMDHQKMRQRKQDQPASVQDQNNNYTSDDESTDSAIQQITPVTICTASASWFNAPSNELTRTTAYMRGWWSTAREFISNLALEKESVESTPTPVAGITQQEKIALQSMILKELLQSGATPEQLAEHLTDAQIDDLLEARAQLATEKKSN